MLTSICPKLPMRNKAITKDFYINKLGFTQFGGDFEGYLMVEKDAIQIHFFEFKDIDPRENDGQVYIRTDKIDELFSNISNSGIKTTALEYKPWNQKEFALLDPDNNLLTFGENMV